VGVRVPPWAPLKGSSAFFGSKELGSLRFCSPSYVVLLVLNQIGETLEETGEIPSLALDHPAQYRTGLGRR
jgi:hypothetical protein